MKLLIIFNPNAAFGRSVKKLEEIKSRFDSLGIEATYKPTEQQGHGSDLVAKTDLSCFDGVIAAGGDGTVFEVLNGLYAHPEPARIPLGLLPIGTGNAFARELDLEPGAWADAVELLHRGNTRKIDVAHVKSTDQSFYFLNIIGMGFFVDASLSAQKLKFLGKTSYTLATLWKVLKLKSYSLEMEFDGEIFRQENILVAISNSCYTGTHFLIAPDAKTDDGLLDITLLKALPRRRLLKLFPTIYTGKHVLYDEISTCKAKTIKIHAPGSMLLGPDGEFCGQTPAEITCLHRDLTIFSQR